jgi:hypothetical protein
METTQLPQWVLDILSAIPKEGEGFHNWLFRAARALWRCGRSENEIRAILENATSTCGRFVPQREIDQAIVNSRVSALQPLFVPHFVPHRQWPAVNREQREAVIGNGGGLVDLWEASPVRIDDNEMHTEEIIDALFPGNPFLCAGRSKSDFATQTREEWRGKLSTLQLIVPSTMTARKGRTQEGKESAHALSITGPRRFLVIEQDIGTVDEQAAVLIHLTGYAPLVCVVHSSGKSIHGWFFCAGQDEEKVLLPFMRYAVSLGADRSTWTKSQFVRMPDGERGDGRRQALYYFHPEVIK